MSVSVEVCSAVFQHRGLQIVYYRSTSLQGSCCLHVPTLKELNVHTARVVLEIADNRHAGRVMPLCYHVTYSTIDH